MAKVLKKRFVLFAMIAVSVLLTVLLSAINIFNVIFVNNEIEETVFFLATRGDMPFNKEPAGTPEHKDNKKDFFRRPMNEDTLMSSRHFLVFLDSENNILFVDSEQISSVDSDTAKQIAEDAIKNNSFDGYSQGFKYATVISDSISPQEHSSVMVFLDVTDQYRNVGYVLLLSIALGFAAWILMLILVIFISGKAIKPIVENIEQQKTFITNAGHEIKTPLAIISANTDAMELYNGKTKWSENIRSQVDRLSGLMQNLLLLSKSDEGVILGETEDINVSQLLVDVIEPYYQLCEAQSKAIELKLEDEVHFSAVPENLRQLFNVLIDNAVKYSVADGVIKITLEKVNGKIIFVTQNNCSSLPSVSPEKLFDRFYRGDDARTQKSGGYGIGLSVAKSITKALGGSVTAEYSDNNSIKFIVKL